MFQAKINKILNIVRNVAQCVFIAGSVEIGQFSAQLYELNIIAPNVAHIFYVRPEFSAHGIVLYQSGVVVNTDYSRPPVWSRCFRLPLSEESLKSAFSPGPVTPHSEAVTNNKTGNTSDDTEHCIHHWATHISFFLICLWLGIWIGYYKRLLP